MADDSQVIASMAAALARKKAAKKRKRSAARCGDSYSLLVLGLSKWLFNNACAAFLFPLIDFRHLSTYLDTLKRRGETGEKRFDPAETFGMVLNILFPRAIIMISCT
jgi:hypothetical protein